MYGFPPKKADLLASTLTLIESPLCPPQWGQMPFAVFAAMVGGSDPLEGNKGVGGLVRLIPLRNGLTKPF
jgi:hypothetical protein